MKETQQKRAWARRVLRETEDVADDAGGNVLALRPDKAERVLRRRRAERLLEQTSGQETWRPAPPWKRGSSR